MGGQWPRVAALTTGGTKLEVVDAADFASQLEWYRVGGGC